MQRNLEAEFPLALFSFLFYNCFKCFLLYVLPNYLILAQNVNQSYHLFRFILLLMALLFTWILAMYYAVL